MNTAAIRGATIITLLDQIRAAWNTRTKPALVVVVIFAVTYCLFDLPRLPTTLETVVVSAFTVVAMAIILALFWFLIVFGLVLIFFVRLSRAQREISYEFTTDSIVVRDQAGMALTTPWTLVKRAREDSAAFRLALRPAGQRYVPKRAFAASDISALRDLAIEKLGSKARLRKT